MLLDDSNSADIKDFEMTTAERTEAAREVPPEVTKWLESSEDILYDLEMDLAGKKYNPETGKYENTGAGEIINSVGRRELISLLKSVLSKNTYMTDFTDQDIRIRAKVIDMMVNDYLFLNCERIGLKPELYDFLMEKISTMVYAALRRAYRASDKRALTGYLTERVITNPQPEPRRKRFGII